MARIVIIALLYVATILLLLLLLSQVGDILVICSELFNPQGSWGLLLFSLVPIKPADDKPRRLTKEEKSQMTLSKELKEISTGLLLGDLNAEKRGGNVRFSFSQGLVHKNYLDHLYKLYSSFCSMVPKTSSRAPDKRTGLIYSTIRFKTLSLPCFNEFYDLFYPNGQKVVPLNIADLLTPLG